VRGGRLRAELFEIPALGTLGIHHGRVPQYRGKKTTFWEIYNGERTAGVTIQRVNRGIDTGDIVRMGEVPIGRKGYGRVWREVEALGADLYLQAVLDFKRGEARPVAQDASRPRPPCTGSLRRLRSFASG
jgi:methionyl-tRNA formyltransferase